MTVNTATPDEPRSEDGQVGRREGIYGAPFVGKPLERAREIADSFEPAADDSWGVRTGKHLVRGSAVAGVTGLAMMTIL